MSDRAKPIDDAVRQLNEDTRRVDATTDPAARAQLRDQAQERYLDAVTGD